VQLPAGKTQRGERGVQAHPSGAAGLREAHRHARHVDVPKLVEPGDDILAERPDPAGEIESGLRRIKTKQMLGQGGIHSQSRL